MNSTPTRLSRPPALEEQQRPRLNALTWCASPDAERVLRMRYGPEEPRAAIGAESEGLYQQRLIRPASAGSNTSGADRSTFTCWYAPDPSFA